ncbi:MAG: helix-turn-helix domain-containing protein [Pseudonocardiaceae bacterium]
MNTDPRSSVARARKELGARLRQLRKSAELTGQALADATGQHFTRVSRIENGAQGPTERNIRDWCAACGGRRPDPRSDRDRPVGRDCLPGVGSAIPATGQVRHERTANASRHRRGGGEVEHGVRAVVTSSSRSVSSSLATS